MKCDICGDNDAVIHVKQIMGNDVKELHLCTSCAGEKGISGEEDIIELSLSQLLTGLIDITDKISEKTDSEVCRNCGTNIKDFRKNGTVGCPECYNVFIKDVENYLQNTAGNFRHTGKLPEKVITLKTLLVDKESLREKLSSAISSEDYEQAAILRDRIKLLEKRAGVGDE